MPQALPNCLIPYLYVTGEQRHPTPRIRAGHLLENRSAVRHGVGALGGRRRQRCEPAADREFQRLGVAVVVAVPVTQLKDSVPMPEARDPTGPGQERSAPLGAKRSSRVPSDRVVLEAPAEAVGAQAAEECLQRAGGPVASLGDLGQTGVPAIRRGLTLCRGGPPWVS